MSAKGRARKLNRRQLRVESLENRCLLAVMAEGVADANPRFADDELEVCECMPTRIEEDFQTMIGESESTEEFVSERGSYDKFDLPLEQPYFADVVLETVDGVFETDEPYIICTLYDSPVHDEVFMTMTEIEEGDSTGEVDRSDVTDLVDEALPEDAAAGGEEQESIEWLDVEDSVPIVYAAMTNDSGDVIRNGDPELPVDEVVDEPVIITMTPDDSGEIERGESESDEGGIEDPVFHTMDDVDVISDDGPTVDPIPEVDNSEVITFGNDGDAAENGPMVEGNVELPVVAANRPNQAGRPQRDGRNRGILQMPPLLPGEPPSLAIVTAMDNRGRVRVVQIEVPEAVWLAPEQPELEPLDSAFSLLRGGRLSPRLGGLR